MKRGEVWTASGGPDYAGKPRPVLIIQDDSFDCTASITICGFTTNPPDAGLARIEIAPTADNGLEQASRLMADKITTMSRAKLGRRIGRLSAGDMGRVNRALFVFLGLAGRAGE